MCKGHEICLALLCLPNCNKQYVIVNFDLINRTSTCSAYKGKSREKLMEVNVQILYTHKVVPVITIHTEEISCSRVSK